MKATSLLEGVEYVCAGQCENPCQSFSSKLLLVPPEVRFRRTSSAWISKVCCVLPYGRSRRVLITGVQMTYFIRIRKNLGVDF